MPRLPSALVASGSARKSASPFLFFVAALHTAGDCSCPDCLQPCCIGLGAQVGLALFIFVASLHTAVACSCPDCLLLLLERSQRVSGLALFIFCRCAPHRPRLFLPRLPSAPAGAVSARVRPCDQVFAFPISVISVYQWQGFGFSDGPMARWPDDQMTRSYCSFTDVRA